VSITLQGLSSPKHCIHRNDPYASYNLNNLTAFFRTVDAMAVFPNTLGVLVANHLINNSRSESCAPVIRAVVRDLKEYMRLRHQARGQRLLPIGFGAGEYEGDRKILNYLATGDKDSNVDFWTVCIYCSPLNFSADLQRANIVVVHGLQMEGKVGYRYKWL
jgi:hypothetical protein